MRPRCSHPAETPPPHNTHTPKPKPKKVTPPSALYYQQRVEYTFPEPVTLAPAKLDGDEWTKVCDWKIGMDKNETNVNVSNSP